MLLPELHPGTLLRRYKRFLADVRLETGEEVTAHCPNTGTMLSCSDPGSRIHLSRADNPARKLKFTWEMTEAQTLIGVNTARTNPIVKEAISRGTIPELAGYEKIVPEVRTSPGSRIDLGLFSSRLPSCYVEVKNCTLVENGVSLFPDAVTLRGQKHLRELIALREQGSRAVIIFLIQRSDGDCFSPADRIDSDYGRLLRQAAGKGVEILPYKALLSLQEIRVHERLPLVLQKTSGRRV